MRPMETEELTQVMEEQIHNAITHWLKEQLNEYMLNEVIFNNAIPNFEFLGVEEYDDLGDYGNIKITIQKEGSEEVELLSHFTNTINLENDVNTILNDCGEEDE